MSRFLLATLVGCLLSCTRANPTLSTLSSSIEAPTFDGASSKTIELQSLSDIVTTNASCDARIIEWQVSLDGATWVDASTLFDSASDLKCKKNSITLKINPSLIGFSTNVYVQTKSIRIKGRTPFGETPYSTLILKHTSAIPVIEIGIPTLTAMNQTATTAFPLSIGGATSIAVVTADIELSGATAGCSVNVVNGTTLSPSVQLSGCTGDGNVKIRVLGGHVSNTGGLTANDSPLSALVTIDNTAPAIDAFAVTNSNPTATTTFSLNFTASGSPSKYCLLENDTIIANCSWAELPLPSRFTVNSTNNAKVLSAWVKDAAGNVSPRSDSSSVTLDTYVASPSGLALQTPAASPGNITTPTLTVSGVSTGDVVRLYTDASCAGASAGSATATGTSVNITSSALTSGSYTFHATAQDTVGNVSTCSTASVAYSVDTATPGVPTLVRQSPASSPNQSTSLTIRASGLENLSTLKLYTSSSCSADALVASVPVSGSTADYTAAGLSEGSHSFYALTIDSAGNSSSCTPSPLTYTVDTQAPTATVSGEPASPSNTSSLNITVGGAGVVGYRYKLGISASTDCSVATDYSVSDIAVATKITDSVTGYDGVTLKLCVVGVDSAQNMQPYASAITRTWAMDHTAPTVAVSSPSPSIGNSGTTFTFNITFTGADAVLLNDASKDTYLTLGGTATAGCTTSVSGTGLDARTITVTGCTGDGTLNLTVNSGASTDAAGNPNLASAASTPNATVDNTAPYVPSSITFNGTTVSPGKNVYPVFDVVDVVVGDKVELWDVACSVKYGGTTATDTTATISLNGPLPSSSHDYDFTAVEIDSAGNSSGCPGPTLFYALDLDAPSPGTISFDAAATRSTTVMLRLNATDNAAVNQMYITNTAGCSSGGAWETYSASKFWTLSAGDGTKSIYAKFDDDAGNVSACVSGSIILDTAAPTTPSSIGIGSVPNDFMTSPSVTFFPATDSGSGVARYEAQVYLTQGPTLISPWTTITSGGHLSNLVFSDLSSYFIRVHAVDNAGNAGDYAQSAIFTTPYAAKWVQSVGGGLHACALTAAGKAYCWGKDSVGQLGNGVSENSNHPVAIDMTALSGKSWMSLSAGLFHSCGITTEGAAYCWGLNSSGQLGSSGGDGGSNPASRLSPTAVSSPSIKWIALAPGGEYDEDLNHPSHTCGLTSEGKIYCWGDNRYGQLGRTSASSDTPQEIDMTNLSGKRWRNVVSGWSYSCGLTTEGEAYCWGRNNRGQLGDGTHTDKLVPTAVLHGAIPAGEKFFSLAAGGEHACLKAGDGLAYCWGANASGQLGNNSVSDSSSPVAVSSSLQWRSLTAGAMHSCGVATSGDMYCWGRRTEGQVGDNGANLTTPVITPSQVISGGANNLKWLNMATGAYATYAISAEGKLHAWGTNSFGQLGIGKDAFDFPDVTPVVNVPDTEVRWTQVTTARNGGHACAITAQGAGYCWGQNGSGQSGIGSLSPFNVPTPTAIKMDDSLSLPSLANKTWISLAAGNAHTCGISSEGNVYCWGSGSSGQIGNNATSNASSPRGIYTGTGPAAGKTFVSVSTGADHSCAVSSDGIAMCWGINTNGELGPSATVGTSQKVPVSISVPAGVKFRSIVSGIHHNCALTTDGDAYCWGQNLHGELGIGGTYSSEWGEVLAVPIFRATPQKVVGHKWLQLAAGTELTCGLREDHAILCWGANALGQIGDNSTTDRPSPTLVSISSMGFTPNWSSVIVGAYSVCGIESSGQAYCWGSNNSGSLGIGKTDVEAANQLVPISTVGSGMFWRTMSAGNNFACGISEIGRAYCWGTGGSYRLGNNNSVNQTTPSAVSAVPTPTPAP